MTQDKPVALVTGANQGIGLQVAKALAANDYTVLVGSRDRARGENAARTIDGDARALQLDVTDRASITAAAARIRAELGRLDLLVNNAAISNTAAPGTPFEAILRAGRPSVASLDEVRAIFETNVFGVVAVTQAMLPLLRESPAARIVNVSSGAGSHADPRFGLAAVAAATSYGVSKAALNALTVKLALETAGPTGTFTGPNGQLPW